MPRPRHRPKAVSRKGRLAKPRPRHRPKVDQDRRDSRSQRQLSARLTRLFQGKVVSAISPTQICRWLKGDLPLGIPLPPQPVNNVYDTQAWEEWLKKHILPLPGWGFAGGTNGTEQTLAQKAQLAKAQREIDAGESTAIDLAVKQGRFKSVEVFNKHIAQFFAEINAYSAEGERVIESKLLETVNGLSIDEPSKAMLRDNLRMAVRQASDNFRAALRNSLETHTETEEPEIK